MKNKKTRRGQKSKSATSPLTNLQNVNVSNILQIGTGLCKSNAFPDCVSNPGITLIWYGCKNCTRVFPTELEKESHRVEYHGKRVRTKDIKKSSMKTNDEIPQKPVFVSPSSARGLSKKVNGELSSKKETASKLPKKTTEVEKASKRKRDTRLDSSERIPCDCCNPPETFSTRKDLKRHKSNNNNNNQEKTINLGTPSTFAMNDNRVSRRNLERRGGESSQFSQSDSENNICPVCNKNFGFRDTLRRHIKIHEKAQENDESYDEDDIPVFTRSPGREASMKKNQSISSLHPKKFA